MAVKLHTHTIYDVAFRKENIMKSFNEYLTEMYSPPDDHPVFRPSDSRLQDLVNLGFAVLKSKLIPEIQKIISQVVASDPLDRTVRRLQEIIGPDYMIDDKIKETATKIIISEVLRLIAQNYDIGNPRLGRDIYPPAWGSGSRHYKRKKDQSQ